MRRLAIACVLFAGCGRLGFDALGSGGPGGGDGGGGDDGAMIDSAGSGSGSSSVTGPVQQGQGVGTGSVTVTLPNPTSASTLLVATISVNDSTSLSLPTGWQSNANGSISGACASVIATSATVPAGQTTFTFGLAAGVPMVVVITEWAGIGGFDTGGFTGGGPASGFSVTTFTPDSVPGDLAIATFCEDSTSPNLVAEAGWHSVGSYVNLSGSPSETTEWQAGEPAAKITATATTSISGKYAATLVTFRVP